MTGQSRAHLGSNNMAAAPRLYWVLGSVTLAALTAASSGCQRNGSKGPPPKTPEVIVSAAFAKKIIDHEDFTGRLEAFKKVDIQSRVTGYLEKIHFKEGGFVKAGDILFEIDPRPYKADLDRAAAAVLQAKARLKRLEYDLARAQALWVSRSISKEDYDKVVGEQAEAVAGVQVAEAGVKVAKLFFDYTKVTSPISGLVSRTHLDEGNLVKADQSVLTTVVTQDPIYAYFDVDERTLLRVRRLIQEGKVISARESEVPVHMALADESEFKHEGTVDFVDNQVDAETGTLRLRGKFANPKGFLAPGMFVRIRVNVGLEHEAVLAAEQGVGVDQGQKFVYVVNDANEVEYRKVKTGALLKGGLRVIEEGLNPGERVIVSGLQRVQPKAKVVPKMQPVPLVEAKEPLAITMKAKDAPQK